MAQGRVIAVYDGAGGGAALARAFKQAFPDGDVRLFSDSPGGFEPAESFPEGVEGEPARRNWINKRVKESGFKGFLHVVQDSVELLPGVSAFVPELESTMDALDYNVWMNTVCDGCNYLYHKYVPLLGINADMPQAKAIGVAPRVSVASHSNPIWTAYNLGKAKDDLLRFDERFTIAMYWIIEFLARRKATGEPGHLYRMNQYLTVDSERAAFRRAPSGKDKPLDQQVAQREHQEFMDMKLDYRPDGDFDSVMQAFWEKVKAKSAAKGANQEQEAPRDDD